MAEKIEFHKRAKGALAEREDWWFLIINDEGARHIVHEWSHHNAYKGGTPNIGEKAIPVEEFLADEDNPTSQLKDLLEKLEGGR